MIEFIENNVLDKNNQSIVVSYNRTVSIPFGNYPYPEDIHNLIILIKQNVDEKSSYACNVKARRTDWDFFSKHPIAQKFIAFCINKHQVSNPDIFQYFFDRKAIESCWGNEIRKGDYVQSHIHNVVHAILYLTEGEPLILPELNIKIHPKPGDYYFFPPVIYHYVNKSTSDKNRYNLIMNIEENPSNFFNKSKQIMEKYGKDS